MKRLLMSMCMALLVLLPLAGCDVAAAMGQQAPANSAELEQLRLDLKRIEARIDAIEKVSGSSPQASAAALAGAAEGTAPATASEPQLTQAAAPTADAGMDSMDAGMGGETIKLPIIPALKIRGFGDVRGFVADQNLGVLTNNPGTPIVASQAGRSTFALGLMDLFVTRRFRSISLTWRRLDLKPTRRQTELGWIWSAPRYPSVPTMHSA